MSQLKLKNAATAKHSWAGWELCKLYSYTYEDSPHAARRIPLPEGAVGSILPFVGQLSLIAWTRKRKVWLKQHGTCRGPLNLGLGETKLGQDMMGCSFGIYLQWKECKHLEKKNLMRRTQIVWGEVIISEQIYTHTQFSKFAQFLAIL